MCADQGSAGSAVIVLLQGFIQAASNFPSYTKGSVLYAPDAEQSTKNVPHQTAPAANGERIQVVGWAVTADVIYVNPDFTIIEITA